MPCFLHGFSGLIEQEDEGMDCRMLQKDSNSSHLGPLGPVAGFLVKPTLRLRSRLSQVHGSLALLADMIPVDFVHYSPILEVI